MADEDSSFSETPSRARLSEDELFQFMAENYVCHVKGLLTPYQLERLKPFPHWQEHVEQQLGITPAVKLEIGKMQGIETEVIVEWMSNRQGVRAFEQFWVEKAADERSPDAVAKALGMEVDEDAPAFASPPSAAGSPSRTEETPRTFRRNMHTDLDELLDTCDPGIVREEFSKFAQVTRNRSFANMPRRIAQAAPPISVSKMINIYKQYPPKQHPPLQPSSPNVYNPHEAYRRRHKDLNQLKEVNRIVRAKLSVKRKRKTESDDNVEVLRESSSRTTPRFFHNFKNDYVRQAPFIFLHLQKKRKPSPKQTTMEQTAMDDFADTPEMAFQTADALMASVWTPVLEEVPQKKLLH